ncbi:DUF433 domain-containing protein [Myxosarcina sp. GI1]|uniref:DUF433 domain-containing protein n=1 Tax=Myxosarcina sp. GI1 TaxID=1541065 RepID=UPI0009DF39D1
MNNQNLLKCISFNPEVLAGKPVIKGLRISVAMITWFKLFMNWFNCSSSLSCD